jgi:hypothetical protein
LPPDNDGAAAATFAASVADWPLFPDTTAALAKLSSALGLKLVVLSNVDRASFAYTRVALERGFTFAAAFTAEEIGSYKLRDSEFSFIFFLFLSFFALARIEAHDFPLYLSARRGIKCHGVHVLLALFN